MVKFWLVFAFVVATVGTLSQCRGRFLDYPFDVTFGSDRQALGSGVSAAETRTVGDFTRIHAEGSVVIDVQVKEGVARTVEVKTDDNLLSMVHTEVLDGVLEIVAVNGIDAINDVHIKVTTSSLEAIHLEGANRLALDIDSAGEIDVHIEGAGRMRATGRVGKLTVHSEGAGTIEAADLVAKSVDVHIEGAGRATVNATHALKARIEGAGLVRYAGNPPKVEKNIDGIGRISQVD